MLAEQLITPRCPHKRVKAEWCTQKAEINGRRSHSYSLGCIIHITLMSGRKLRMTRHQTALKKKGAKKPKTPQQHIF